MGNENNPDNFQPSFKEERVRKIAIAYYFQPEIRKAIFEFSKNRECVPRYFEGFGKRPDAFQYDSDIIELVKKGATSFHCSEEIWKDPLELSTNMRPEELSKIRIGWDLLIDIDCKYPEYSKKGALAIISAMKKNGVKNIGAKFSGSKGFHIIVPFAAFPEELSGKKTAEMFPEWPRLICQYLKEEARPFLEKDLYSSEDSKVLSKLKKGIKCERCGNMSEKAELSHFSCPHCRAKMQNISSIFEKKRKIRCPNCQAEMKASETEFFYRCKNCQIDSRKNPEKFNEAYESLDIFDVLGLDVILVSPRHLFRMPYSLHEKTALASVVISPEEIMGFDMIKDADPFKAKAKNFIPDSEKGEATSLLVNSLEFKPVGKEKTLEEIKNPDAKKTSSQYGEGKKFSEIIIKNLTPDLYPPSIQKILSGMKTDGKKRALFIILSFFKALKMPDEEIQSQVEIWNKKNSEPIPPSYIKGQIMWYAKQKEAKLPPNFDKSYYKDIGINPTEEELKLKNPVNYVKRKAFFRDNKTKSFKK